MWVCVNWKVRTDVDNYRVNLPGHVESDTGIITVLSQDGQQLQRIQVPGPEITGLTIK